MVWLLGALGFCLTMILRVAPPPEGPPIKGGWGVGAVSSQGSSGSGSGQSVFTYQEGKWFLLEADCPEGFVPGSPPTEKGLFEGHCVKVANVRSPGKT